MLKELGRASDERRDLTRILSAVAQGTEAVAGAGAAIGPARSKVRPWLTRNKKQRLQRCSYRRVDFRRQDVIVGRAAALMLERKKGARRACPTGSDKGSGEQGGSSAMCKSGRTVLRTNVAPTQQRKAAS